MKPLIIIRRMLFNLSNILTKKNPLMLYENARDGNESCYQPLTNEN
jgi:hypothetical protein